MCKDNIYKGVFLKLNCYCHNCKNNFLSNWASIQGGRSCPICAGKQVVYETSLEYLRPDLVKEFLYSENEKTPNKLTKGSHENVYWQCLICEHKWWAKVSTRMNGKGCPKCKESKGEKEIARFLNENNIKFERQYKFNDCKNKQKLPFDFYLPDYNVCIEFQGLQHFREMGYFGGKEKLERTKLTDEIKEKYCHLNNIHLLKISYLDIKNIDNILKNFLNIK